MSTSDIISFNKVKIFVAVWFSLLHKKKASLTDVIG